MIGDALRSAGLVTLASMFLGVVPLALGVVYAIWPSEQRLALMRPLSLATIFAAITGTAVGLINVFAGLGATEATPLPRVALIGLAESLVPLFSGFGCLTVAWLCVTLGMWRRP